MPRHRSRQNTTHRLTAERDGEISCATDGDCPPGATCVDGTCVDAYGTPKTSETIVMDAEPVEYDSGGTSYVRGSTGERVSRTPTVFGNATLAKTLREGDAVTLDPLDPSPDAPTLSELEIVSIDAHHGRRARAGSATIELEQN